MDVRIHIFFFKIVSRSIGVCLYVYAHIEKCRGVKGHMWTYRDAWELWRVKWKAHGR